MSSLRQSKVRLTMRVLLLICLASLAFPLASGDSKFNVHLQAGENPQRQLPITGDFHDNTQGHCLSRRLQNLKATERLFSSRVELVEDFLQTKTINGVAERVAIDELSNFVSLTRAYLPPTELFSALSDTTILQSIMFGQAQGPDQDISAECMAALNSALASSLSTFAFLMNVGGGYGFTTDVNILSMTHENFDTSFDSRRAFSHVLQQIQKDVPIFEKYMATFFGFFEAFGEFQFFNTGMLYAIQSWEDLAVTSVSLVAKYASVYLSQGELLAQTFNDNNFGITYETIYAYTLEACIMTEAESSFSPTVAEEPSVSPTGRTEEPSFPPIAEASISPTVQGTPNSMNQFLPVIAVAATTYATTEQLASAWTSFRTNYPNRPFCLLQVREGSGNGLAVPIDFFSDPKTIYQSVSPDRGDTFSQSDWFDLCNLKAFMDSGTTTFLLYMGSTGDLVTASELLLKQSIALYGGSVINVSGSESADQNWITPVDKNF